MKVVEEVAIPAAIGVLWALLQDVSVVAGCVPGVTLTVRDRATYDASIAVRLGFIRARFDGVATIAFDEHARTVSVRASGADRSGGTRVAATMDATLGAHGPHSVLHVESSLDLSGPLQGPAELAGPTVVRRLLREFAACIETKARPPVLEG